MFFDDDAVMEQSNHNTNNSGPGSGTGSILFSVLCFSASVTYNSFIAYCVANTLAPQRTKKLLIDTAWFGLEMFTIVEMTMKQRAKQFEENVISRYPWLTLSYWKQNGDKQNETDRFDFIDDDGMVIPKDNININAIELMNVVKLGVHTHKDENGMAYMKVIDTTLDTSKWLTTTGICTEENLKYKLMACTIDDSHGDTWLISLNDNSTYSYYILGNVLLTKPFLKMYARRHMNPTSASTFISRIDKDTYTVKIIDNRVNQFQWTGPGKAIELHECGPLVVNMAMSPCHSKEPCLDNDTIIQDDMTNVSKTKDKTI